MEKAAYFDFCISAYTPDTIPMYRLARYMFELAKLMGSEAMVHFAGLKEGSTVLSTRVECENIERVEKRLQEAVTSTLKLTPISNLKLTHLT